MKERVRIMFDDGIKLKDSNRHIEALKKFDEVQQMIKQESPESALEELNKVYNEIAIVCNILSMKHL